MKKIFSNTVSDFASFITQNGTKWFMLVGPYIVTGSYMVTGPYMVTQD